MLKPVRTTAPTDTPISLDDVRRHLRVDHTDEDVTLDTYIDAATQYLDGYAGILGNRALVSQTWQQSYPVFTDPLVLPLAPVQPNATISITYYDADNAPQTLDGAVYRLLANASCGPQILLEPEQSWPPTYARADAVTVTFVAGYGAAGAVPAPIKQAMLLLVGGWYANREVSASGAWGELPFAVSALLTPFRRLRV